MIQTKLVNSMKTNSLEPNTIDQKIKDYTKNSNKGSQPNLPNTVNDFTPIIFANRGHVPNRGQLSASTSNLGSDPD